MGEIVKLPVQATKLGYKRVKKRCVPADSPDQLDLFPRAKAQILAFTDGLSPFERALLSDENGDPRAGELYAAAIEERDCVADAFCNLGIIESQKGNTIKAFDCFTTTLKHSPRHAEAHYNLGNLYFELNDFRLAQIHYEMTSQIEASFPNAYFNLALVQAINNDPASALKALTKYKSLVAAPEARVADELFQNLKKSLDSARRSK
jgi:tetratricopeptide (TPR) repeat protein